MKQYTIHFKANFTVYMYADSHDVMENPHGQSMYRFYIGDNLIAMVPIEEIEDIFMED